MLEVYRSYSRPNDTSNIDTYFLRFIGFSYAVLATTVLASRLLLNLPPTSNNPHAVSSYPIAMRPLTSFYMDSEEGSLCYATAMRSDPPHNTRTPVLAVMCTLAIILNLRCFG